MNGAKWLVGATAILLAASVLAYKMVLPSYSYRYRLHLTVEVGEKTHAGSSVIQVNWGCGPKIADASGCAAGLSGQATLIDLGTHGVLVAALHTGDHILPTPDGAIDAIFLCAKAFGNQSTFRDLPELSKLSGRRALSADNFPRLVWFTNGADPASARKVTRESMADLIDPTAKITDAFVEITRDPVAVDLPNKLTWFEALKVAQKESRMPSMPQQFHLYYNMLVGEDT
ncbi:hypothetical protein [Bradyrhizobium sp. LTSP857]|uniref:hypothetical protein n=1 Tax=Bradyrhizobium sp. LTSP857 TaxID=1619231 RepID=UPI0005D1F66B|nr:hypothetical protein [Bradyrhizobium sp. LTSP857]KJC40028.1 hypothetical protein UP06_27965 [Bradyrhizobium sp. LTSP857]